MDMIDRVIKNDPSDKINYYNIACLYAIMGQTDDALDMLEASTLGNGRLVDQAKNDGDFDSLRNHPRFIALIEQQTDPPVFPNP
jgi:adenylate cyclase